MKKKRIIIFLILIFSYCIFLNTSNTFISKNNLTNLKKVVLKVKNKWYFENKTNNKFKTKSFSNTTKPKIYEINLINNKKLKIIKISENNKNYFYTKNLNIEVYFKDDEKSKNYENLLENLYNSKDSHWKNLLKSNKLKLYSEKKLEEKNLYIFEIEKVNYKNKEYISAIENIFILYFSKNNKNNNKILINNNLKKTTAFNKYSLHNSNFEETQNNDFEYIKLILSGVETNKIFYKTDLSKNSIFFSKFEIIQKDFLLFKRKNYNQFYTKKFEIIGVKFKEKKVKKIRNYIYFILKVTDGDPMIPKQNFYVNWQIIKINKKDPKESKTIFAYHYNIFEKIFQIFQNKIFYYNIKTFIKSKDIELKNNKNFNKNLSPKIIKKIKDKENFLCIWNEQKNKIILIKKDKDKYLFFKIIKGMEIEIKNQKEKEEIIQENYLNINLKNIKNKKTSSKKNYEIYFITVPFFMSIIFIICIVIKNRKNIKWKQLNLSSN